MQIFINKKIVKSQARRLRIHGRLMITETLGNIFLALKKGKGNVVFKASIGQICKKLHLEIRKTALSAELLGKYVGTRMHKGGFVKYAVVIAKKITRLVRNTLKGVLGQVGNCKRITVLERVAHNGIRLRSKKRK
jgi:hypothetical protein